MRRVRRRRDQKKLFGERRLRVLNPISFLYSTNPFETTFHALQAFALGATEYGGGAVEEREPAERLAPHADALFDEMVEAADAIRAGLEVDDEDAEVQQGVALFALFQRYGRALQGVIDDRGVAAPFYDRFAEDHARALGHARATAPPAPLLFAIFYQMRRAFHFISTRFRGPAPCVGAVRAALWKANLGGDVGAYAGGGYLRMGATPVLITGATGTGKESAARCVGWSRFVPFDPGARRFAIPFDEDFHARSVVEAAGGLVESALFGHKRGSFTGAAGDAIGCLALPREHGTLFLDEIGELPRHVQAKLLRPLESREYVPVGETRPQKILGRLVFATHRDLPAMCGTGAFRPDLYERINAFVVRLPKLAQILAEAPASLAVYVAAMVAEVAGPEDRARWTARVVRTIEEQAPRHTWPRNLRELRNYTHRFVLSGGDTPPPGEDAPAAPAEAARAPAVVRGSGRTSRPPPRAPARAVEVDDEAPPSSEILGRVGKQGTLPLDDVLRAYVTRVYFLTGENLAETARRLGMDWRSVRKLIDPVRLERLRARRAQARPE
jgi:DNA-binding NtrC family response regulator